MAKSMIPSDKSPITAGQIGKIQEMIGAGLRKANLPSDTVQKILETQGDVLVAEVVDLVRRRIEVLSNLIGRCVRVDRSQTPEQALAATGRRQYTDPDVVRHMPRGQGEELDIYFFSVGRFVSDVDLKKEYESRGLVPADPYILAKVNQDDPSFADQHPNGTHWKDKNGRWCFVAFDCWDDERRVDVDHYDGDWHDYWLFAGVRK